MSDYGGWEPIGKPLGKGGQGTVYKARSPQRVAEIRSARMQLRQAVKGLINSPKVIPAPPKEEADLTALISAIRDLSRDDVPTELGALKRLNIPGDDSPEAEAALQRFKRETEALKSIQHPGILKLIEASVSDRWLVTEYHPGGTLADDPSRYKGDALSALQAFRSIVEAVAKLHEKGYVHRDIKPSNVFIGGDGRLILGDFGIVFFEDPDRTRLTDEVERVGSRDWMAPWAHTGVRVDDVKPTFDIFPLGKLLWVMVSGRPILPPYRTHVSPQFRLEEMFPRVPGMELVNSILDKCLVTEEQDCLHNASPLHDLVVEAIKALEYQTTLQQVVLAEPDGHIRVQLTVKNFQLIATPLRRDKQGQWVLEQHAASPLGRWQLQANGGLLRIG